MKKRYISIAVIALVVGGAAIAYAAIPDSKGIIYGCRNNGSGVLRVIDSGQTCLRSETALDWVQSAGFEVYRSPGFSPPVEITAVNPDDFQHVMSLTLQPGSYQISTSVEVQKDSGDGVLACLTLTAPGFASSIERAAMGTDPGDSRWLEMSGTGLADFPSGGTAELKCRQRPGPTGANPVVDGADITAVRIGTISQHEDGQG
jgi:hypothetical protein